MVDQKKGVPYVSNLNFDPGAVGTNAEANLMANFLFGRRAELDDDSRGRLFTVTLDFGIFAIF